MTYESVTGSSIGDLSGLARGPEKGRERERERD
jgi:hypothetical protein